MLKKTKKCLGAVALLSFLIGGATGCTKNPEEEKKRRETFEQICKDINKATLEGAMVRELKNSTTRLEIGKYIFDFDHAEILKAMFYDNDHGFVVYIRDLHEHMNLQKEIFYTMEELLNENGVDLLVIEGRHEEELTRKNIPTGAYSLLDTFFPSQVPNFKRESLNKIIQNYDAREAFELVYDDKVKTCGAEDQSVHTAAVMIAYMAYASEGVVYLHEEVIVNKRSYIGVEKLEKYMKEHKEDIAMMTFGGAHTRSIIKKLEELEISYIVIQPKTYAEELEGLYQETLREYK